MTTLGNQNELRLHNRRQRTERMKRMHVLLAGEFQKIAEREVQS